MKYIIISVAILTVCLSISLAAAQDKVVIVPLGGKKAVGDAVPRDVVKGKTFSNSSGTGLTGTRPPAPVGTDGIDHEYTVQPPNPRFYNTGTIYIAGYGVGDHMTALIWQRNLSSGLYTPSEADAYCEGLETGGPVLYFRDWRLPTITELQSLIAHTGVAPALPTEVRFDVFTNLDPWGDYWSSTLVPTICPGGARGSFLRYINMGYGETENVLTCVGDTPPEHKVWCVRGPNY